MLDAEDSASFLACAGVRRRTATLATDFIVASKGKRVDTLVKTGIAGLDEVLLGGIPRHNNLIVEGAPGSGKTTLGLGFIYAGAADYD